MTEVSLTDRSTPRPAAHGIVGTVYSIALLREAPEGFLAQAPYRLAMVRLGDGSLITAQLTDMDIDGGGDGGDDKIKIGDKVEMVTRKLTTDGQRGMIVYGYKFRPVLK